MKNKQGFTIIEAIFSMIALAIILIIIIDFMRAGLRNWIGEQPFVNVQNTAREIVSGSGNWRGMESELREGQAILNADPDKTAFYLRKDKIRFIGSVAIVNGIDSICSTLAYKDDIQSIGTGSIPLANRQDAILITVGTSGSLYSIPGDINGDGTATSAERDSSDDYARGWIRSCGKDAVILMGNNTVDTICYTNSRGDDVQVVPAGNSTGIGKILITPGNNGILDSIPGDYNGDGDNEDATDVRNSNNLISSAVISYEYLPGTNTIIRKINEDKPDSKRHLGPYLVAEDIATFTITYYGTDGVTTIPYGTVTLDQVNSIGMIEIKGEVRTYPKGGVGKGTVSATFQTKIQPRAINPAYRRR
ncbi:MAG: hypothetical protein AB1414_08320 [bacterium]